MRYLLIAHTLGIVAATCFAVIDSPSIVVSGALLSASGALIALISYRRDLLIGFLFGLAAPTLSMSCVLAISLLYSRPSRAHEAVCVLLVLFSMVSVAMCVAALGELRSERAGNDGRKPLQYSIGGLLLLTLALSGALSLGQTVGTKAATSAIFVAYVGILIYVLDKFVTNRRLQKLSERDSFLKSTTCAGEATGHVSDDRVEVRVRSPLKPSRFKPSFSTHVMFWLLVAQAMGILIGAVCAVFEIESIMASGPILSLSGGLIALLSFHRDRLMGLLFGLAAPTVAMFCLFVIATRNWSPPEAQIPVSLFLVVFGLLCVPACALAVLELETSGTTRQKVRFQFSIAAMLVLMLMFALVFGFAQTAGFDGAVTGIFLGYLVVLLYVLNQFFRNRRLQKLAGVSSFLEGHE